MSTSEEFKKHGIVPDVIAKPPEKRVRAVFDSGVEVNYSIIHRIANCLVKNVKHPRKKMNIIKNPELRPIWEMC